MSWITTAALTAAPLVTLTLTAWRRLRSLSRALAAERTRARLMDATYHRDLCALKARLTETRTPAAEVLAAAEHELDLALAIYATTRDPKEGGSP